MATLEDAYNIPLFFFFSFGHNWITISYLWLNKHFNYEDPYHSDTWNVTGSNYVTFIEANATHVLIMSELWKPVTELVWRD